MIYRRIIIISLSFLENAMTEESVVQQVVTASEQAAARGKSTVDFPYLDLENAIEIVKAVHKVEGDRCEWIQLATSLGVASEGGGYRMRMLTAKTFGLLTYEKGQVMLTDVGIRAADPNHEKKARFDAFMCVELFRMLFERYNGQQLPPTAAIERAIENLGVAPKQKDKVRQVFMRSAKQAGLFELALDRLSIPPGLNSQRRELQDIDSNAEKPGSKDTRPNGSGLSNSHDINSGQFHPFIVGLLHKLPEPEKDWTAKDRAKWLQTAANIFDLMYTGSSDGEVAVSFKPASGGNGP
jgi:hypothetical protein